MRTDDQMKSQEQKLLDQLGQLPREIAPRNDPWPQVEQRIQATASVMPESRSGWNLRPAWGGAIAASVALAFVAGWWAGGQGADQSPAIPQLADVQPYEASPAMAAMLQATEAEYQAAFREFIAVGDARQDLPLKTIENIEMGWADLVAAEEALTEALAENPGNPFLVQKMLELRSRQLAFLKNLAGLDRTNRRMTI